jgi:hypothetical protein
MGEQLMIEIKMDRTVLNIFNNAADTARELNDLQGLIREKKAAIEAIEKNLKEKKTGLLFCLEEEVKVQSSLTASLQDIHGLVPQFGKSCQCETNKCLECDGVCCGNCKGC